MDFFVKTGAGILVSVVLCLLLDRQGKEFSILLAITVCCMALGISVGYFQKILDFLQMLVSKGSLNNELIQVIFKATGIGILGEITSMICVDSGNSALGKTVQILSAASILWLCIPLFSELISLVEGVLSKI